MAEDKDTKARESGEHGVVDGFVGLFFDITHVDAVVDGRNHDDNESEEVHDRECPQQGQCHYDDTQGEKNIVHRDHSPLFQKGDIVG